MSTSKTKHLAPLALMAGLTPESVGRLIEFHRATFGDARMDATTTTAPAERPEGVSEEEWNALGDPGKAALVREREARTQAERDLAAARAAKPAPPGTSKVPEKPGSPDAGKGADKGGGTAPDLAAVIQQAVQAAVTPLQERLDGWETSQAAQRIQESVQTAAASRFHDPSDVLAQVDLASLTDGNGGPDQAKISAALDDLATRKPHLVKPWDDRRRPAPGSPIGATGPASVPLDDRVRQTLARMQQAAGIKPAAS